MKHWARNRFIPLTLAFLWAAGLTFVLGCGARRGPEEPTLPLVSGEPVAIQAISYAEERGYTRVTIEGSREFVYELLEVREDPLRISVEISDASLDVDTPISVNNGTVTEIVAIRDEGRGRIDIGLADRVDYTITQEANRLYVDIESAVEARPFVVERPAVAKEIETLITMGSAKALKQVSATKRGDVTEVTVTADGIIGDYNAFTLTSPPRLVIDLWDLANQFPKRAVEAGTRDLRRIRIGTHAKKTRLVLDIPGTRVPPYRIDRFQNELLVALGNVKILKEAVTGVLAGVDFKQIDDRSRVVLSSSVKVEYEVFKVSPRDVVIDLKKTSAPKHLERGIDTRAFESAVEYIRLYGVKSGTSRDVRVVIHLREAVDFETLQEGKRIFVDFQMPWKGRTSARDRATAEAISQPANPDKGVVAQAEIVEASAEEKSPDASPSPQAGADEAMNPKDANPNDVNPKEGGLPPERAQESPLTQVAQAPKEGVQKVETETKGSTPVVGAENRAVVVAPEDQPIYEIALTPGKRYTGRHLSLDFKDADIKNILRLIAEVSQLNIVAGEDVKGKVTIRLVDVPWDQALDIILFSNNLGKMRMGNVIRVAPAEALKKEEEQHLTSKRAKERLEDLVTELIPVNYSLAQELQPQVKNILSERGALSVDTRTNTLVIKDIPTSVAEARDLVASLDTKTPQVIIEARIVEAATNFSRELGIKWGGTLPPQNIGGETGTIGIQGGIGVDTVANFPVDAATSAITFNLANLGDITNLDVELSALETAGEGKIISAPRITTLDNTEAHIEQGLRIPYLKLTAEGTATTEFVEANINLTVTPHVTADGHVKMNIKAAKDTPDDSITVQGVPAIDKKEAITEVLVKDGDVVVIAGLYSIEKADGVERVPLLGKVPILGWLFKRTSKSDDRRDLLIFISPRIVQETA